jgi:DNA end-binding protein Ku
LVTVPIKAYPAIASGDEIHFNQLHAGCGQRIRYQKTCPVHGKVEAVAITKGYQYVRDQYVVVEESELEAMRPPREKDLSLEHFVDADQVDPALFSGRSHYLLPDGSGAQHAYAVILEAMLLREKWAVGWITLSGRRTLVLVRPAGRLLTMHLLHFPALVRARTWYEAQLKAAPSASTEELELASLLIDRASSIVSWSDFRDDSSEKLLALVEAKIAGREIVTASTEEVPLLPLVDALKESALQLSGKAGRGKSNGRSLSRLRKKAERRPA